MNPERLVTRARSIVLQPREAWPTIAAETDSIAGIYRNYVIWLAALPALGVLIGTALFGIHVPILGTIRIGFGTLLAQAVLSYLTGLLIVFLLALVVDALAPTSVRRKRDTAPGRTTSGWKSRTSLAPRACCRSPASPPRERHARPTRAMKKPIAIPATWCTNAGTACGAAANTRW